MSDIKVLINENWVNARNYQKDAYEEFKKTEENGSVRENTFNYNKHGIIFQIRRVLENDADIRTTNAFGAPYLVNEHGGRIPIIDFNNIYAFLPELPAVAGSNWHKARDYQAYAYVDFLYSNEVTKKYRSNPSATEGVLIELDNIEPDIAFSMSRNFNKSIYYERNDYSRSRVKICDCKYARNGYQGYFNRMTYDIMSVPNSEPKPEPEPTVLKYIEEISTDIEEQQCCICFDIKQNIKFIPCNHVYTCSKCYKSLHKKECPMCKQVIENIIPLTVV